MTDMLVLSGVSANDFRKENPACPTAYFTMVSWFVATGLRKPSVRKVS
jgi:hypothetical protein